jgi:putative thioredoxin
MASQPAIFDVREADFRTAVLERSRDELVLVDFWAGWCAPCRQLAPILERLATTMAGRFVLARVNTDEAPELAASLRIQSIPTVLFFLNGRVVDEFTGVVPESTIRELVERHAPSTVEPLVRRAEEAEAAGRLEESLAALREALASAPEHPRANLALGHVALRRGLLAEARSALERVPAETPDGRGAERILSAFDFFDLAGAGEVDPQSPKADLDRRLRHAARLATTDHLTAALDELLAIITADKQFADGLARKAMLGIFVLLGQNSDTTRSYQDQMARILY